MTDRLIVVVDTLLVCLGLTMTVAAVGPLIELATHDLARHTRLVRSRESAR